MLALWTAVTLRRPLATAYSKANRAIRSDAARVMILMLSAASRADHVLDAGVQVLGVLADDDEVDVLVARLEALHRAGRAQVRVQAEGLAQRDVDAPEALADRRRDRALEGDLVALDRLEDVLRERRPVLGDDALAGVHDLPVEGDAGGVEHATGRLRQLRTDAVAGDQGDSVGHALDCSRAGRSPAERTPRWAVGHGDRDGRPSEEGAGRRAWRGCGLRGRALPGEGRVDVVRELDGRSRRRDRGPTTSRPTRSRPAPWSRPARTGRASRRSSRVVRGRSG